MLIAPLHSSLFVLLFQIYSAGKDGDHIAFERAHLLLRNVATAQIHGHMDVLFIQVSIKRHQSRSTLLQVQQGFSLVIWGRR
jgi:hypothetical protein